MQTQMSFVYHSQQGQLTSIDPSKHNKNTTLHTQQHKCHISVTLSTISFCIQTCRTDHVWPKTLYSQAKQLYSIRQIVN